MTKQHTEFFDTAENLALKLQFLIDHLDASGFLPEHCFTFPDGDTWTATTKEPQS